MSEAPKQANADQSMWVHFWGFVVKRHEVWHRRYVLQDKPPWTDDDILASNHFTNMYRELDPGTKHIVDVLAAHPAAPLQDKLFNVALYRLALHEGSQRAIGWLKAREFDALRFAEKLRTLESPYTSAYTVSNYGRSEPKHVVMADVAGQAAKKVPGIAADLYMCQGRKEAHDAMTELHGWGDFLAFQVLVDLAYKLPDPFDPTGTPTVPWSNYRGWAAAGPGTQRGLRHLWPDLPPAQFNAAMALLEERCMFEFERRRAVGTMPTVPGTERMVSDKKRPIPLSRANIANCLCEFSKYVRLRDGDGGGGRRRLFVAKDHWAQDLEAKGHGQQLPMFPSIEATVQGVS